MSCSVLVGVVTAALLSSDAAAQVIRGQVVDSVLGRPVTNGFVVLLSESGSDLVRSLTDDQGRFVIQLITPGTYRIRSERIGYRAKQTMLLRVRARESIDVALRVVSIPRRLEEIRVTREGECRPAWEGVDTATLWEEVRKALTAASWTAEQEHYSYRMHHVAETRVRNRQQSIDISVAQASASAPFRAEDIERLLDEGYVVEEDGRWTYYAPDANVLLDERFHETHCFGTKIGDGDHRGLVGLTFRPISSRRKTDVKGVVWIDRSSLELRRIEFVYERLPFSTGRADPGGSIRFQALASGAWIVHDWVIRMSIVQRRSPGAVAPNRFRPSTEASEGSTVIEAFGFDGRRVYTHRTTGQATPHTRIAVVGTGYDAVTNAVGEFSVNTLLEGEYVITSARLDSLGYRRGRVSVRFEPRDTVTVNLTVPKLDDVYDYLCDNPPRRNQFIVVGQTLNAQTDNPLSRVIVTATTDTQQRISTRTDEEGWFVLCQLPATQEILLEVRDGAYTGESITLLFKDGVVTEQSRVGRREHDAPERIWRADFRLHTNR